MIPVVAQVRLGIGNLETSLDPNVMVRRVSYSLRHRREDARSQPRHRNERVTCLGSEPSYLWLWLTVFRRRHGASKRNRGASSSSGHAQPALGRSPEAHRRCRARQLRGICDRLHARVLRVDARRGAHRVMRSSCSSLLLMNSGLAAYNERNIVSYCLLCSSRFLEEASAH